MNTLYNQSRNPKKSTKGTGFKDEEKALETIKIIKKNLHLIKHILSFFFLFFN